MDLRGTKLFFIGFILLALYGTAFSSRKTSVFRRDLTSNELTKLFNSKVEIAEYMTRPLDGKIFSSSGRKKRFWGNYKLEHAGVRVTLSDDSKWLIHKGNDFGDVSSTVITSAEYMSSRWTMERRKMVNGALIVDDFMQAAYINEPYNLVNIRGANCQKAAHAMFDLLDGFPEN